MIKVIEHGKKNFEIICPKCGCRFSYELEDVDIASVKCPDCGYPCVHPKQEQYTPWDTIITPINPCKPCDNITCQDESYINWLHQSTQTKSQTNITKRNFEE